MNNNGKIYQNLSNIRDKISNNNMAQKVNEIREETNIQKKTDININPTILKTNTIQNTKMIELRDLTQKYNKITPLEESANKISSRTIKEDYDNLGFLTKKYVEEKERNLKLEAEKRVMIFQEESKKKLTKKLINFTELRIRRMLKIIDFIICFFILSDVSLSVYTNMRFTSDEFDLNEKLLKERFYTDQQIEDLRICIMGIVFVTLIMIIVKYHYRLKIMRSTLHASERDTIFSTGLYKKMLLEMLVLTPFTPPELNGYFTGSMLFGYYSYSSDSFILLIKMFKLYYLAVIYSHLSLWTSDKAKEIARNNKASIGANFAFKATIKRTPFFSIIVLLGLSLILLSFMLRIFEYGFSQDATDKLIVSSKAIKNVQFDSYFDVFWVVIISMMTVGYGDIFPKTHMGRMVVFVSSIMGMIIQSLLIVRLSNFVELTVDEKKAYNEIKKVDDLTKLEEYSTVLIKSILKLMQIKINKNMGRKEKLENYFVQMIKVKKNIINFNKIVKMNDSNSIALEDLLANLRKKFEMDVEILGPFKYLLDDVVEISKKINNSESEIHHSIEILKNKQIEISDFLVNLNNIKTTEKKYEDEILQL